MLKSEVDSITLNYIVSQIKAEVKNNLPKKSSLLILKKKALRTTLIFL